MSELQKTVDSTIWCEKYKPKDIDDVLISDEHKTKFKEFLQHNDIPHLLFSGNAGNGKCVSYDTEIEVYVSDSLLSKIKEK